MLDPFVAEEMKLHVYFNENSASGCCGPKVWNELRIRL
jgi:hypothetical protein